MNIFKKTLNLINKNLFLLITLSIVFGLINLKLTSGYNFSATICLLASFIMIMPSLVPFDFKKIFKREEKEENTTEKNNLKNTQLKFEQNKNINISPLKTIFLTIFLNFILYPAIAFLIATFFFSDNKQLFLGIILLSILPGGGMITTWALSSKANMTLTIKIIFYNLLFAVLFIPFISPLLINENKISENSEKILNLDFDKIISENNLSKNTTKNIEENISEETQNTQACVLSEVTGGGITCGGDSSNPLSNLLPVLFIIIIFPLFLAFTIQKLYIKILGEKSFENNKNYFGSFSNLGLVITLFIIMSFNTNKIIFEKPELFLKSIIPVLLFYIITFSISFFIMKKFYKNNKKEGLAFFWGSTLRYITLILAFTSAIAISDSSYTIIIVIVIIAYLIQIPASFWFAKYFKEHSKN